MSYLIRHYVLFICIAIIAGGMISCDNGTGADVELPDEPHKQLAWATAAALDNDEVRESVHGAMQNSQLIEHKLVLQDFLETNQGAPLRDAIASRLGDKANLDNILAELPDTMDFYVPYETHRETWEHAEENLMVVSVLDPDAREGTLYRPGGESIPVDSTSHSVEDIEAMGAAVFVIHPEEPKIEHNHDHDGDTIHPADEGNDNTKRALAANFRAKNAAGTFAKKIVISFEDGGVFNTRCEVYFKSIAYDERGLGEVIRKTSRVISMPQQSVAEIDPDLLLHHLVPTGTIIVSVGLHEADSGLTGGDDYYGNVDIDINSNLDTHEYTIGASSVYIYLQ